MAEILCFVGIVGAGVAILLVVILSFMNKNAWAGVGLFALCVLIILGSGFLPSGDTTPDASDSKQQNDLLNSNIQMTVQESNAEAEKENGSAFSEPDNSAKVYRIGDTWTVDGQWSVTVTGVSETTDRNQYSDKSPEAVYILDYTYTNLGYEADHFDGVFISLGGTGTVVDSKGMMAYEYPGDVTNYAVETPVGATCSAQSCIGVDNAGGFKIVFSQYDGNDVRQSATFEIDVS